MLFLRDITRLDAPPAVDDYATEVAITVDAQTGRWTRGAVPELLADSAAVCLALAGLVLLLAGDREVRATFGLVGAAIAAGSGLAMARRLGRHVSGGLIALSAVTLWAAAGAGLAGLADSSPTAALAAALGSIGVGAAIAILVAGDAVLVPSVGIIAATLLPALVMLCPIALGSLAVAERMAVRLAGIYNPDPALISVRAGRGRQLLAALLIGVALFLIWSSAILAVSGGWFAWGLVAASALAVTAKARHFRFTAEVAPLLVAGLAGLLLLELPLVAVLSIGPRGAGGGAAVLSADALLLALTVAIVRRWDISPRLRRQLGRLEAFATAATVPLAIGVLGAYATVGRLVHGFT